MNLLQQFKEYISKNDLFHSEDKLLLAVSGGVDSVVLCELCKQSGYDFAIAHCNFQLRGADSDRDETFVKDIADKYKVPFHLVKFDTTNEAKQRKLSIQETARELRYKWFEEIRKQHQYHYILTAHHADDNIETVLLNFFRGTGVKGLRGIEVKHSHIVRPLLFARRSQLEEFIKENGLEYVTDSTNLKDDYSRNYLRLNVLPLVKEHFSESDKNILENIDRFKEIEILYQQAIEQHKKKLLEYRGEEIHIPVLKLKKSAPLRSIVYEITKEFGFSSQQTNEIIALLDSETGKYIASSTHRIFKNRNWLIIAPLETGKAENIFIEKNIDDLQFANGRLQFEMISGTDFKLPNSNFIACLDADEISFPLILRKWKQGDYFYPLGMKKKKKLSRFFIDQKLSKTDKEKIWVIEMDKKIIWIVGHRIDERFKVTDKTKEIFKIDFTI